MKECKICFESIPLTWNKYVPTVGKQLTFNKGRYSHNAKISWHFNIELEEEYSDKQ